MTRDACDCLNDCGDDPAVQRGEIPPCEYKRNKIQEAERKRLLQLETELNARRWNTLIACLSGSVVTEGTALKLNVGSVSSDAKALTDYIDGLLK
jgi:hypothetical protein